MDDLVNLDDSLDPKAVARQRTIKEMANRSQDRIRVYNPTEEDYTIVFDGEGFLIPGCNKDLGRGLGIAIVLRYVAVNYRTQIIYKILTRNLDTAIKLENERRVSKGMSKMEKGPGQDEETFSMSLRTDNQEARAKLIPVVWLGLEERYGSAPKSTEQILKPRDDRSIDDLLTDKLEKERSTGQKEGSTSSTSSIPVVADSIPNLGSQDDLASKDVFTLRKIAHEKGIEVEKTAKKNELIKAISQ